VRSPSLPALASTRSSCVLQHALRQRAAPDGQHRWAQLLHPGRSGSSLKQAAAAQSLNQGERLTAGAAPGHDLGAVAEQHCLGKQNQHTAASCCQLGPGSSQFRVSGVPFAGQQRGRRVTAACSLGRMAIVLTSGPFCGAGAL
jgi:hypothetical protein